MPEDLPAGGCWFGGGSAFVSGRTIRAMKPSTSDRVGGHEARGASWAGGAFPAAGGALDEGISEAAVGVFSDGCDKATDGVFSKGRVGAAAVERVSISVCCDAPLVCAGSGTSAPPRMIGRPSLLLPMITVFALLDCDSCSVASMP